MTRSMQFALSLVMAAAIALAPVVSAESHVRIVRLSFVDGQVQMDRATGSGLERAILNTPVVEKTRIITSADGLAEVEFENGNTLRLTGDSEIQFSRLLINDAGMKVNEITVSKGTVYLDARAKGDDIYRLTADGKTLVAQRGTKMRLSAAPEQLQLAVFKGDVEVAGPQPLTVARKETLTLNPQDSSNYKLTRAVETQPSDAWDNEREAYGQAYARSSGYGGPSSGYGLQDLNYYGDFSYLPGYGYAWQPYGFAGAMTSWSPYSNGAWMFYPGMGYAFAASYPWGWLPFHYGSWAFVGNTGWVWLPGGSYGNGWYSNGFHAIPKIAKQPAGWSAATPPAVTTAGARPTVTVGTVTNAAAYIPGGRMPPNFASVIPGRNTHMTSVANSFARPDARTSSLNNNVFARSNASYTVRTGHVFAAPARSMANFDSFGAEPALGARGSGASGMPAVHSSSSGHASSAAHH